MFPMRIKINAPRNNELRCCFCLHVRTATILLGIWHLILHILALSVLAIMMRNHQIVHDKLSENDIEPGNLLPTPLSKTKDEDNPYYLPTTQDGSVYAPDVDMGALMTVCTLAITLLMVYGTVKGKATHLLPFFCLQLFDFTITTLTATGYFCYLRSVHQFVAEHYHNLPYRKELLQMSPQYLSLLLLTTFLVSMLWKAYCISIVWRCYKYLTLRQENARSTVHYILRGEETERIPDPEYLLPDYEAACASFKQPPPPSYQAAVEQPSPPAYPEATTMGIPSPRYGFIITQSIVEARMNENNNSLQAYNVNERGEAAPRTGQDEATVPDAVAAASASTTCDSSAKNKQHSDEGGSERNDIGATATYSSEDAEGKDANGKEEELRALVAKDEKCSIATAVGMTSEGKLDRSSSGTIVAKSNADDEKAIIADEGEKTMKSTLSEEQSEERHP